MKSFFFFAFFLSAVSSAIAQVPYTSPVGASNPFGIALTQPTFIRSATNTSSAGVSTITISGFNCTGGNYMVISGAETSAVNRTVTSITTGTGAQTATNIITQSYLSATTGKNFLYGIVNPTTGDVVVTMGGVTTVISVTVMLFNNVGSTGLSGAGTAGSDFSGSARTSTSDSITTVATDLVVDALAYTAIVGNPTAGVGQTVIGETTGTATAAFLANSTKAGGAGSTTMGWTFGPQTVTWVGAALGGK